MKGNRVTAAFVVAWALTLVIGIVSYITLDGSTTALEQRRRSRMFRARATSLGRMTSA